MKYSVLSYTCHYITVRCQKIGYLPFYIERFAVLLSRKHERAIPRKNILKYGKKIYKNIHLCIEIKHIQTYGLLRLIGLMPKYDKNIKNYLSVSILLVSLHQYF